MAITKNAPQETALGSDIFPITAKFNYDGSMRFRIIYGVEGKAEQEACYVLSERTYGYNSEGLPITQMTVKASVEDVFNECAAARAEGRHADLTKLEAPAP